MTPLIVFFVTFVVAVGLMAALSAHKPKVPPRRRRTPHESAYLTHNDVAIVAESLLRPATTESDRALGNIHPDWDPTSLREGVVSSGVLPRASEVDEGKPLRYTGLLLHPDGSSVIDYGCLEHPAKRIVQRRLEGLSSSRSWVYLSREDVKNLAHYSFYIAINHGYNERYVYDNYPGWTWGTLYNPLREKAGLESRNGEPTKRYLPEGAVGVVVTKSGDVLLDFGSLLVPEDEQDTSTESSRLTAVSWSPTSPVVIYSPYTGGYLPSYVHRGLAEVLPISGRMSRLHLLDEPGCARLLRHFATLGIKPEHTPSIVTTGDSPLLFDLENIASGLDQLSESWMAGVKLSKPQTIDAHLSRSADRRKEHLAHVEGVLDKTIESLGRAIVIELREYREAPNLASATPGEVRVGCDPENTPVWLVEAARTALEPNFDVQTHTRPAIYLPERFAAPQGRVSALAIHVKSTVLADPKRLAQLSSALASLVITAIPDQPQEVSS